MARAAVASIAQLILVTVNCKLSSNEVHQILKPRVSSNALSAGIAFAKLYIASSSTCQLAGGVLLVKAADAKRLVWC